MAETVAERLLVSTYHCRNCNRNVLIFNTELTCPLCASGFMEVLPPNVPADYEPIPDTNNASTSDGSQLPNNQAGHQFDNDTQRLSNMLSSGTHIGQAFELTIDLINGLLEPFLAPNETIQRSTATGVVNGNGGSGASLSITSSAGVTSAHELGLEVISSDNALMDAFQNFSDAVSTATIMTDLVNEEESGGPPPMSKAQIKNLPTVEVGEYEVEQMLKCSVCLDYFQMNEPVRKLSCAHLYHGNCIVQWLELHATCPMCRTLLVEEKEQMV